MFRYDLSNLCDALVQREIVTPETARRILAEEDAVRKTLEERYEKGAGRRAAAPIVTPADIVAAMGLLSTHNQPLDYDLIANLLASLADLPFERPDPLKINMELVSKTVSRPFATRHSCLPLRRSPDGLVVAVDNPFDRTMIMTLTDFVGEKLQIVVSAKPDIQRIISDVYGFRSSIEAAEESFGQRFDINNLEQLVHLQSGRELEGSEQPIVNAVEYLLRYAFDQRASDIHIEPKRMTSLVRLRIDGVLHNVYNFPKTVHAALVSRLKMLSRMDISEKRRPQDGRMKTSLSGKEVELRVSSMPVAFGEKMVLRIFDPDTLVQNIEKIGFLEQELETWQQMISRPNGLILVTGPTGSGKTTTLYSTLKEVSGPDINLTTVEDPIEMVYEAFNQVAVQPKIGVDFASALRTILRQDPDVIMVGEIRDRETAVMAVQSALTGHLVFSTLHTNDASSAITRLTDLGVEPFLLASTLIGVLAQRLVRKICPSCKKETRLDAAQIERLGLGDAKTRPTSLPAYYGGGCVRCRRTGYYGRVGVFEMMKIDNDLRRLIEQRASAVEIRQEIRKRGVESLRSSAIRRLARGVTTYEEVLAVTTNE